MTRLFSFQAKQLALCFLFLSLHLAALPLTAVATPPKETPKDEPKPPSKEVKDEKVTAEPSTSANTKTQIFPTHLDISSLRNLPLVILHPKTPINFQMLPGDSLANSIQKSLNHEKIMELVKSAAADLPSKMSAANRGTNRQARNRNLSNLQPQPSVNRPVSTHFDGHFNDPALQRSFLNPNNGWLQRFKGSFSNMMPVLKPMRDIPVQYGLPTMNMPVYLPHHGAIHSPMNPMALGSYQHFHSMPWRGFHTPSMMHYGDLSTEASHMSPVRMLFGNPFSRFRPSPMSSHHFGGDLATSGSAFVPRRIVPYLPFGHAHVPRFVAPVQPHKPLFNNVEGLQAASMEISNAFADFTDAKEHGPEVTQKFGSVGHTISTFLKMMGLGGGDLGGFGGGADFASMDSTPIARSLDFYPGYGNQAHMDDLQVDLDSFDDFPIFEEDVTQQFMDKMNLTNGTTLAGEKKIEIEGYNKETTPTVEIGMEVADKNKLLLNKGIKVKAAGIKLIQLGGKDVTYAPADQLDFGKEKDSKPETTTIMPDSTTIRPIVNYKIPPILSTVSPKDRIKPVAVYQVPSLTDSNEAPKPLAYAPAQAMPYQEGETNPNKLVDEDVVRQWRVVNDGQGVVEKRPVPIVDVLKDSSRPESLKVLKQVLMESPKVNP